MSNKIIYGSNNSNEVIKLINEADGGVFIIDYDLSVFNLISQTKKKIHVFQQCNENKNILNEIKYILNNGDIVMLDISEIESYISILSDIIIKNECNDTIFIYNNIDLFKEITNRLKNVYLSTIEYCSERNLKEVIKKDIIYSTVTTVNDIKLFKKMFDKDYKRIFSISEVTCTNDINEYSGDFKLRLPKSLHKQLSNEAEIEGVSLNQYLLYILSKHCN